MLNVTVKRSKWARGTYDAKLRNPVDGLKCCLGFVCTSAGVRAKYINDKPTPADLVDEAKQLPSWMEPLSKLIKKSDGDYVNSKVCEALIDVNDSLDMDDPAREKKLTKLGLKANIAFTFVD